MRDLRLNWGSMQTKLHSQTKTHKNINKNNENNLHQFDIRTVDDNLEKHVPSMQRRHHLKQLGLCYVSDLLLKCSARSLMST